MTISWRTFALAALVGAGVFWLAQVQAQYRRPLMLPQYRPPMMIPQYRPPLVQHIGYGCSGYCDGHGWTVCGHTLGLGATPPFLPNTIYTNPLILQQNIALNQQANYNTSLYMNRLLMTQYQLYNPLYSPTPTPGYPTYSPYATPGYPTYPYMTPSLLYTGAVISPGLPYNTSNVYNPYFAAFGFRP